MTTLTPEQTIAVANSHLDRLVEMVRTNIEADPHYDIHRLVATLGTRPCNCTADDQVTTLAYNLALAVFRFASEDSHGDAGV